MVNHPIDPRDRVTMAELRSMVIGTKGSVTGPSADGVTYEKADVAGAGGWWCRPDDAAPAAILYLHGGAYVVGSVRAYQHFVGQVAARAKVAAFVPEYGLAPKRPFPAAVDDAQASFEGLVEQGFGKIALAGDSAGGASRWCFCR